MRFRRQQTIRFLRSVAVGALVGIVFSILFVVLPSAGLIVLISSLDMGWDLQWIPSTPVLMGLGALVGGGFSAILFIKDQYVPYVEPVQDFEEDDEHDFPDRRG